jgi:hypothetical protein
VLITCHITSNLTLGRRNNVTESGWNWETSEVVGMTAYRTNRAVCQMSIIEVGMKLAPLSPEELGETEASILSVN